MESISEYGILSILPPLLAIILAVRTKLIYISLLLGIWLGYLLLADWNIFHSIINTLDGLVNVFKSEGNTRTIMFALLGGGLIELISKSKGIAGFINFFERLISRFSGLSFSKKQIIVQLSTIVVGLLIFIESNVSILTSGSLFRSLYSKYKLSAERLAYFCDTGSAPSSVLIPFNGWGAFILSLLVAESIDNPIGTLLSAIGYNFYPILITLLSIFLLLTGWKWGPLSNKKELKRLNNIEHNEVDESTDRKDGKFFNAYLPIVIMVLLMPVMLFYTGFDTNIYNSTEISLSERLLNIMGNGSGSASVLYSMAIAIGIAMISYMFQKIFSPKKSVEVLFLGMSKFLDAAILMVFAFAISTICKELGTGVYLAKIISDSIPQFLVVGLIFVCSAIMSFSTGTSWGTFAIMVPLIAPLAGLLDVNIAIYLAAVMGGGVWGDHCSPISDTTIISSMASNCNHMNHVRTQLPYAMVSGIITFGLYLLLGLLV